VKSGPLYTRQADPSYPFAKPKFGRVSYESFDSTQQAVAALAKGDVDAILARGGLPPGLVSQALSSLPSLTLMRIPSSSARFLAFNPSNPVLSDPALRQALSCALDRLALAGALQAQPLDGFVLVGTWKNPHAASSCAYTPGDASAVTMLRDAGYRWAKEPAIDQPGEGLLLPDGSPFPEMTLLSPDQVSDLQRAEAARLVAQYAGALGMTLSVQYAAPEEIRYAVYSSGRYDMALLGWRLSEYPAYLCEWFQPPGAFAYGDAALRSACDRLSSTADLGTARGALYEIQSILLRELPFIPLYQGVDLELSSVVSWPWDHQALGGISGLYGAPELAIPAP
jgi:ABC-type transport system substrate-binding protein